MRTTWEERQLPANTVVPCPKWCDKDHSIDSLDNSGVHSFVSSTKPKVIKISQGFGDGVADSPVVLVNDRLELAAGECLPLVQALIYAALLLDEVATKD